MIEFEENKTIKIEYEMTVAIAQFENLKPKVHLTCDAKEAGMGLEYCRQLLGNEYKKVKELLKTNKEKKNENKN